MLLLYDNIIREWYYRQYLQICRQYLYRIYYQLYFHTIVVGFAHKNYREYDYTSGVRTPGSHIFVMYCEGKKILFEPNRDLVEALRNTLPHKVHMY